MRDLFPLISPDSGRFGLFWLLHCIEPGNRTYNSSVIILRPSSVHSIYTAAHKRTLWTQEEYNDVCYLLRRSVSLKSTWFVERCVCWPATQVPMFLHERCVYRSRSHGIYPDLTRAILLSSGLRQSYHPVFAGIVCGMTREP